MDVGGDENDVADVLVGDELQQGGPLGLVTLPAVGGVEAEILDRFGRMDEFPGDADRFRRLQTGFQRVDLRTVEQGARRVEALGPEAAARPGRTSSPAQKGRVAGAGGVAVEGAARRAAAQLLGGGAGGAASGRRACGASSVGCRVKPASPAIGAASRAISTGLAA